MVRGGLAISNALIALIAIALVVLAGLCLRPHGTTLFIIGLVVILGLGIYAASDTASVKPVAIGVFDVAAPALLATPPRRCRVLQIAAGRRWRALGATTQRGGSGETVPAQPN
jgi:hypothetical protein